VTAGRSDAALLTSIAVHPQVQYVLMYAKDATPRTTIQAQEYSDVVQDITQFLQARVSVALQAGIKKEQLILDPGLGHFVSSEAKYSLEILKRLNEFAELGFPMLLSPSRKSCLAGKEKVGPDQRLPATLAATAIAALQGVSFIRTHDVVETRRACELVASVCNS
jgi:dihydropteroate synthase